MAHFANFSANVRDYRDRAIGSGELVYGDEAMYVLWGGGPPPGNDALDVVVNPAGLGTMVEVAPITSINRKFRFIANGSGSAGTLEGRHSGAPWATLKLTIRMGPPSPPKKTAYDLYYDGVSLSWPARSKTYKATSGLPAGDKEPDWRDSKYSCVKDHGPVPEGIYSLSTVVDPKTYATGDQDTCVLDPGGQIQKIPRGATAGTCEPYWANWGTNRVRINPADEPTRNACTPTRDGFYLHDSTKGFSHGCVELETTFFDDLYDFSKKSTQKRLTLEVRYKHESTQGGTKKP